MVVGGLPAANASGIVIREDFAKYFGGLQGTFVLYDGGNHQYTVYNEAQAGKRLSPCSTFKIFNSLIGLESGVLEQEDEKTLLKWDGTQYTIASWNKDHTLQSATADSVVWYFQEVATRVGADRMQSYINQLEYGNRDISGGITRFWLRSSLQISAYEQVDLIKKLYQGDLPFSPQDVEVVKRNILLSNYDGAKFSGKTGSGSVDGKLVLGWFVGCVEKEGQQYIFATNVEGEDGAYGGKAKEITKAILKDMNITQ
jgi:bla regulator protein BlaR1